MSSTTVTIVPARENDAETCSRIKSRARAEAYSHLGVSKARVEKMAHHNVRTIAQNRALIEKALTHPETVHYQVAKTGKRVIGFVQAVLRKDDAVAIKSLFVDPDEQLRGVGKQLLDDCLSWAGRRKVILKVVKGNQRAISLYESRGFINTNEQPYSELGVERVVMERRMTADGKA